MYYERRKCNKVPLLWQCKSKYYGLKLLLTAPMRGGEPQINLREHGHNFLNNFQKFSLKHQKVLQLTSEYNKKKTHKYR